MLRFICEIRIRREWTGVKICQNGGFRYDDIPAADYDLYVTNDKNSVCLCAVDADVHNPATLVYQMSMDRWNLNAGKMTG